ncbi:hypothetical protein [Oceanobacillus jeddahense]|uniref:Uncharacterized protein n=1 Tax=Oceanobacillus jeddahense TaxID=1462527 RepID=A0ABY5JZL0_9BACI|nr:hypothetical protein [Oceanobacillus jeddahense]UUI05215.1 hypothetical protein NP439_11470 [Oceanobacillus jeddahense]
MEQNVTQWANKQYEQQKEKSYLDQMQESQTNELHNQSKNQNSNDESGDIVWKKGDKEISQGKEVNLEDLKKLGDLKSDTINGHEVNYMVKDGELIIFKDNPNLTYFTEKGKQGNFNYWTGFPTFLYANFKGTQGLKKAGDYGVEKINKALNWTPNFQNKGTEVGGFFKYGAGYMTQHGIPLWSEIIGTPVPKTGSSEVILYISEDDGETWDGKVRFEVDSEGVVTPNDFSNQDWKEVLKKAFIPNW